MDFGTQLGGFWDPTCMILLLPWRPRARGRLPQALRSLKNLVYIFANIGLIFHNKGVHLFISDLYF